MSLPGAARPARRARGRRRRGRPTNYTPTAKALHWLTFALLIVQYGLAWAMPEVARPGPPESLNNLHMSFGAAILVVTLVRLYWRIGHLVPIAAAGAPLWVRAAALLLHYALYALLVAQPLLGWAWASAKGWPVRVFGLPALPPLVAANSPWGDTFEAAHTAIATALLGLIAIHVLAVLHHRFVRRDDVLRRMMPGRV